VFPEAPRRGLIVNIPEMRIYYVRDGGSRYVTTYPVGLGRDDWRTPQGGFKVRGKTQNPTWVIPDSIRAEHIRDRGDARTSIDPIGSVYVDGEMWSARAEHPIPEGTAVRVISREGLMLNVKPEGETQGG